MATYNLSTLGDNDITKVYTSNTEDCKSENRYFLKEHDIYFNTCGTENGKYRVLKYDKKSLTPKTIHTTGLFRSVILKDDKILGFSPPKSMREVDFMDKYGNKKIDPKKIVAEDFIEGTMINVFFDTTIGDNGDWVVCTRSNVGARTVFYRDGPVEYEKTFRYMFLEAATNAQLIFDNLPKEYCYSFVLQHPNNRIVVPVQEPNIYLVGCYSIDNDTRNVTEISRGEQINIMEKTMVCFPGRFSFDSYSELKKTWASDTTDYKVMGVVIKNIENGDRTKYRNPVYECVRKLRGNQPKLQYQYLILRKEGSVSKYLKYFSEDAVAFSEFRNKIHKFTSDLHANYIKCYVKKEKPLKKFPSQFRPHMFNLHSLYRTQLRDVSGKITKRNVIEYINYLHPSKLMFSINFTDREQSLNSNDSEDCE